MNYNKIPHPVAIAKQDGEFFHFTDSFRKMLYLVHKYLNIFRSFIDIFRQKLLY